MKIQRSRSEARTAVNARGRRSSQTTEGGRNNYPLDVIVPTDTKSGSLWVEGMPPSKFDYTCKCTYPKTCHICR